MPWIITALQGNNNNNDDDDDDDDEAEESKNYHKSQQYTNIVSNIVPYTWVISTSIHYPFRKCIADIL